MEKEAEIVAYKDDLQYIDETSLCIKRKKRGKGFTFFNDQDEKILDSRTLKRLKELVIPPMWSDVMICKFDDGHIQATGRDLKGRKQYIYHSEWERQRQEEKFARMAAFGRSLPKLRKVAATDLKQRHWNKTKVLALMVSVLDETGIRIGNKQYVQSNGTYGLSTLRKKHMELNGKELVFKYKGKSNKQRQVTIEDRDLIRHIKKASQLPGYEIFRYLDEDGKSCEIDSHDVNAYIAEVTGKEFTSKDYRTWVGSRLAIELYPEAVAIKKASPRKKLDTILVRMVADELGNTPTICRGYYVHPVLLQKIEADEIPNKNPFRESSNPNALTKEEKLLLMLLESEV